VAPPMPIPQPPPQTIRMAPPPPPAPIAHAPASVRSSRHNTVAVPGVQPAKKAVMPAIPPRQTAPHARPVAQAPPQPIAFTPDVPPLSSESDSTADPNAIEELSDDWPDLIGSDFSEVVNEAMNSPETQEIMQDPRYLALVDAVSKGETSAADVSDDFLEMFLGAEGDDS